MAHRGVVGAKLPKSSPLPPLQPNFTPSEASLEVLQLLNADEGESSEMSEDAIRHTLQEWLRTYDAEQNQYTSVTVFAEMKLRQALVVTSKLGLPNPIRTAAVCSCFDRVASLFHRYEGLLRTLRGELLRSIYVDYRPGAVIGGGAQAYSMCTPYFEELRKEKRKTAELRGLIKEWGEERTAALQAAEERRKSLELVIEQLKRLAAGSQPPAPPASAGEGGEGGEGGEAEPQEGKELTGSERLLQLLPDLEAAVESVRQEHEAAFLDPVSKITQLQESLSQYQQLRLLQRGLRELGPTLMAELPPAERASMTAALLEQVPEAELQPLLLQLVLLRQPPQLLELLEAAAAPRIHSATASTVVRALGLLQPPAHMVAASQHAWLQAAAAELDQSLAAELLVKLAARCFDATPTASGRRLSVARRSSLSGASQARRASGMVAGQAASPAPVAFAALVQGVLGAAPEEERVVALTHVLRQQEVVPRVRRAALAEALGAPVAEVDELRLELSRSRESLRALTGAAAQAQAPEPARFQRLFGVDLPPPLPGGANAPAPGDIGALPPHAARQLVGELFALKLAETVEMPGGAAGALRPARSRRGEMPPPFARFAYEALLRKHGVRSTARQALRMLLAAVEPTQDASGRTPTPTPPTEEEDPFLLFAPMCGIGGAAAPWAPAKVDFFFHALGKVPTGPAYRPCLPALPAGPACNRVHPARDHTRMHPTRRRTGLGPAAQCEPARSPRGAARFGARGRAAPARLRVVRRRREPRAARAVAGSHRQPHGDSRGRRRRQRGRAGGRARGAAAAAHRGALPPLVPCTQAAIVYFPRLQPCVPSAVAACHPACNPMCPRHGRSSTRRTGSGSARLSPPRSPPPACSRGTSSRRSCARSRGRLLLLPTPPLMTSASESCTRQPLTARAACQQAQSTLARSYE